MSAPPARTSLADTYPNPSNATFRSGIGAFWDFATGLLGITGNAAEARDALGIGSAFGLRNRVRNGNFAINQRLRSGSVVLAAGVYGHDGWKAGASGCSYTFATSGNDVVLTITAGSLIQVIEGALVEGGDYIMSWTGTAQGKIGAGSYAVSGVAASSVTANSNLSVEFGTGSLGRVQLEPGLVMTPFERRPIGLELQLCMRYYQQCPIVVSGYVGVGQANSTTSAYAGIAFQVPMRAAPTFTNIATTYQLGGSPIGAMTTVSSTPKDVVVSFAPSGLFTTGQAVLLLQGPAPTTPVWTASAEL